MASIKQALNTAGTATITLASLANGSGRASTAVDNSSGLYLSADIRIKITTGGTSATGYASVYLIRSEDGTNFDDAFAGTDGAYTPVNALLLGTIVTPATATYVKTFDTAELGLTLPAKWCVGIVNSTGNTLSATAGNHSVTYREKYLTVA
jgi:hypothetical protein